MQVKHISQYKYNHRLAITAHSVHVDAATKFCGAFFSVVVEVKLPRAFWYCQLSSSCVSLTSLLWQVCHCLHASCQSRSWSVLITLLAFQFSYGCGRITTELQLIWFIPTSLRFVAINRSLIQALNYQIFQFMMILLNQLTALFTVIAYNHQMVSVGWI